MERLARFFVLYILGSIAQTCYLTQERTESLMRKIAEHYGANIRIHKSE